MSAGSAGRTAGTAGPAPAEPGGAGTARGRREVSRRAGPRVACRPQALHLLPQLPVTPGHGEKRGDAEAGGGAARPLESAPSFVPRGPGPGAAARLPGSGRRRGALCKWFSIEKEILPMGLCNLP